MRDKNQALEEIAQAIEATGEANADDYDLETILDEMYNFGAGGYVQAVDHEEFWASVERNAVTS